MKELDETIELIVNQLYPEGEDDWWCPNCMSYVIATFEENCNTCGVSLPSEQPSDELRARVGEVIRARMAGKVNLLESQLQIYKKALQKLGRRQSSREIARKALGKR